MDERPVVQQLPRADERRAEDLGPISPELVLVDPVLADQARKLLPEPDERYAHRTPIVREELRGVLVPPAPRPRRRWPRTVALAVVVFAAGAALGSFLRRGHPAQSGVLEVRTASPPQTAHRERQARPRATRHAPASRAPASVAQRPRRRRWAVNVLGVAAQVAGSSVSLAWQRPVGSGHVVVLRALGDRQRGTVVFRGHATSFRDVSSRPCTVYRYTIVNYDRSGHRSTGVPTSVVTAGCT
jgi:hypothetical protein